MNSKLIVGTSTVRSRVIVWLMMAVMSSKSYSKKKRILYAYSTQLDYRLVLNFDHNSVADKINGQHEIGNYPRQIYRVSYPVLWKLYSAFEWGHGPNQVIGSCQILHQDMHDNPSSQQIAQLSSESNLRINFKAT